ncbi:transposase [Corynebacterium macginleyi]|nr:transposase [Corynebacterium macginleyi]
MEAVSQDHGHAVGPTGIGKTTLPAPSASPRATLDIPWPTTSRSARPVLTGLYSTADHGSVYTSQAFRNYYSSLEVRQSIGAVVTSGDNALAESFNAKLKQEVLQDRTVFEAGTPAILTKAA